LKGGLESHFHTDNKEDTTSEEYPDCVTQPTKKKPKSNDSKCRKPLIDLHGEECTHDAIPKESLPKPLG